MSYYLGQSVIGNFKGQLQKRKKARDRRDGMSEEHLALVRQCPCAADRTYAMVVDPHHLCLKAHRGVGLRVPDRYTIPLSRARHTELHRYGSRRHVEILASWGIDGEALAGELWHIFLYEPAASRLMKMRAAVMGHTV